MWFSSTLPPNDLPTFGLPLRKPRSPGLWGLQEEERTVRILEVMFRWLGARQQQSVSEAAASLGQKQTKDARCIVSHGMESPDP